MRNLKKFLALVLAMMMTLSLMVTVNAANVEFEDGETITDAFLEDITVLAGMGVFEGYGDGTFKPTDTVTRAEMAAIVYRLVTGDAEGTSDALHGQYGSFKDVSDDKWYAGYVGYCANAGLILGYGDGTFRPSNKVTGYEALVMVLRAMGYDQPTEFSKSDWRTHAASIATQRGLLSKINATRYQGTLSQPALREVVGEIAFQAANPAHPMVQWTAAFGYQTTGMSGGITGTTTNPSLGQLYYGLACDTGIVVGNQATGEDYTLLDFEVANTWDGAAITNVKYTGNVGYGYDSKVDATSPNNSLGNITIAYDADTGLDLFGHKVNMWYDNRTATGYVDYNNLPAFREDSEYTTTYAVIDKASLAKTVWADDLVNDDDTADKTSVYTAAVDAGFSKLSAPAWESDRFCQIGKDADDNSIQSKVGMYTVISNNANKTADVVISLNQEVARITQVNSTVKDGEYIYIGSGNSKFGDELVNASGKQGLLLNTLLSPTSDKTLGDVVTVNEVVGTTYTEMTGDKAAVNSAANARTIANAATTFAPATVAGNKFCRYDTAKLEPAFTGTISTYIVGDNDDANDHVVKVVLTDGTAYDLSGITGAEMDAGGGYETAYQWDFDDHCHLIDGALTTLTGINTAAGVTFSFYEDAVGRFIGVGIPNDYEFLYTTFADYEIGALGTGTIGYYTYGVDWDGNIVKTNNQVKTIRMPVANASDVFTEVTADTPTDTTYPNSTGPKTLAEGYNALPVTLKDQGSLVTAVGNQIRTGVNTRFMLSPNGDLDWYSANTNSHLYNKYGTRFTTWYAGTDASNAWTINAQDAANGFARVKNDKDEDVNTAAVAADNVDYLLTNDTKFIVVTGSGTADLSVKIYNGLTELLDGGTSAIITSGIRMTVNAGTDDDVIDTTKNGDNVYFLTNADVFGNTDTDKNHTINTVIMADTNLTQYNAQSLYFSAPGNEATGVKLAGYDDATGIYGAIGQYELYNNGEKAYYWVAGANAADGTAITGDFYRLTPIGEVNGQPIYMATNCTQTSAANATNPYIMGNDVDVRYDYIVVNNLSTADINGQVFNVSGATVCEAYGKNVKNGGAAHSATFVETNTIDSVEKLHHAVSMGKAGTSGDLYYVYVAIVNDGINVSTIYVTDVNTATH